MNARVMVIRETPDHQYIIEMTFAETVTRHTLEEVYKVISEMRKTCNPFVAVFTVEQDTPPHENPDSL